MFQVVLVYNTSTYLLFKYNLYEETSAGFANILKRSNSFLNLIFRSDQNVENPHLISAALQLLTYSFLLGRTERKDKSIPVV